MCKWPTHFISFLWEFTFFATQCETALCFSLSGNWTRKWLKSSKRWTSFLFPFYEGAANTSNATTRCFKPDWHKQIQWLWCEKVEGIDKISCGICERGWKGKCFTKDYQFAIKCPPHLAYIENISHCHLIWSEFKKFNAHIGFQKENSLA